ncbi:MAG: hypothetical protein IIX65_07700 [Lachnospiraceae bacterium]|nr:hypothetical protein [Lachnospiraceae bacterium]
MKNKAPLPLMEQLIMVLVFALAAALCLQGFALSDRTSNRQEARSQAVNRVQNAAEILKYTAGDYEKAAELMGGDWDGNTWTIYYNGSWQEVSEDQIGRPVYVLQASPVKTDNRLLGSAQVSVSSSKEELFRIVAAWQEVPTDEG